jgi:hypothetical protein
VVEPRRAGAGDLGQRVAAADPDPRLRERLGAAHGGVTALVEYDALLERRDLDAVLVFADNRTSAISARWGSWRGAGRRSAASQPLP